MKWWVYKCNNNSPLKGDWRGFFENECVDAKCGNVRQIPDLNKLTRDDMIIAYQTDRNELVGTCQMLRFSGEERSIHLKSIRTIGRKVNPLKKGDKRIAAIPALQPGIVKTLYPISTADAMHLLKAADASKLSRIQSEKARIEGEKRTVETSVRDPRLRADAKAKWGLKCYCCGFEFARFYGDIAKNVAIVHHLKMFKGKRRKATVQDVRVVCANCHQVIHVHKKPIHVDDLSKQISGRWARWSHKGIKSKSHR